MPADANLLGMNAIRRGLTLIGFGDHADVSGE